MKNITTTLLLLLSTVLLFSMANDSLPVATEISKDDLALRSEFRKELLMELRTDQLIAAEAEHVKIEFEYHDIFVNETIIDLELTTKYQALFQKYSIEPGPQRQIRLLSDGCVIIGDFGLQNELLEPVKLEYIGR